MNSFSDQKFMKQVLKFLFLNNCKKHQVEIFLQIPCLQIYRSLGKRFWDCERILDSIIILPYSKLTRSHIDSMKAYICPSLIHWVSIPINENVLLDVFAKSV